MNADRLYFTPLMNEIADVIGPDATLLLVEARGGMRVHIPAYAPEDHWLSELLGKEAAARLCAYFRVRNGGSYLTLPLGSRAHYARQRRRVVEMAATHSTDQMVGALGVSRTFVKAAKRGL